MEGLIASRAVVTRSGAPVPNKAPAGAPASLLPAPSAGGGVDSVIAELMKLSSAMNDAQSKSAEARATAYSAIRKAKTDEWKAALDEAIEAARKAAEEQESGGPFDFITDNLGPVGLVGMIVGSAYIVAADVAAHAVGLDDGKLDVADAAGLGAMLAGPVAVAAYAAQLCVKKFGPEELQKALDGGPTVADGDVRLANRLAFAVTQAHLAIAATVASGGTAAPAVIAMIGVAVSTATQILKETGALDEIFGDDAKWAALIGAAAGAALGIGGGIAMAASGAGLSEAKELVGAIEKAKAGLEAVHAVDQGITNLRAADYQHEADDHQIQAKRHKYAAELLDRLIDDVIEDLKAADESAKKTTELCQSIGQIQNQTMLLAGSLKG